MTSDASGAGAADRGKKKALFWVASFAGLLVALAQVWVVWHFAKDSPEIADLRTPKTALSETVAACVERGIDYFKEAGAYPVLATPPNSGRRAEDVALERCRRNPAAF